MNTYSISMSNEGEHAGSNSLEVEADSLVQAVFIAGAHWAGNVASSLRAQILGVDGEFNHYFPLLEDGTLTITAEQI